MKNPQIIPFDEGWDIFVEMTFVWRNPFARENWCKTEAELEKTASQP